MTARLDALEAENVALKSQPVAAPAHLLEGVTATDVAADHRCRAGHRPDQEGDVGTDENHVLIPH